MAATKPKAYLFLVISLAWFVVGGPAMREVVALLFGREATGDSTAIVVGMGTWLLLTVGLFMAATATWAKANGSSPVVGALLGLLGPIGLLILIFLPGRPPAERR